MTITIPPEALEAAARTIADLSCPPEVFGQCEAAGGCVCREFARAACLAMLKAWPGMELDEAMWSGGTNFIVLPLPRQERTLRMSDFQRELNAAEDIVVLMRKWAEVLDIPSGSFVNDDCRKAADEINSLRVENDALAKSCAAAENYARLRAEVERLRAALEKMQRSRDRYRQAWEAEKTRASLGDTHE